MAVPTNLDLYQGLLYQLDRYGAPTFEVPEFNYWWNFGTRKFISKTLEVFDLTQKVTDALRALVRNGYVLINETDETSFKKCDLPENYNRLLNCFVTIRFKEDRECYSEGDTLKVKASRLTADLAAYILDNTYHKPRYDRPYYHVIGNELHLFIDTENTVDEGVVIESVDFQYIGQPNRVKLRTDFDTSQEADEDKCEFDETVTDEITKVTLKLILERQGDAQRLQTNTSLDVN